MKKILAGVMASVLIFLVASGTVTPVKTYAAENTAQVTTGLSTVSNEELVIISEQLNYLAGNPNATASDYVTLMNSNPYFNLRAYMYYNEDLMSKYTYSYYKYYEHYLKQGYKENRVHIFLPDDSYNTITIGRYTTPYKANTAREENLKLACNFINGTIIQPGGSFSYNDTVGERTTARGFKVAHIYVSGTVSEGVGGGICQISSTLYVAMMIAGIPATEHHFHSLPVDYLKKNLDATVSWKSLDLKFVNPYDYPIMIIASADGGQATVGICKYTGK